MSFATRENLRLAVVQLNNCLFAARDDGDNEVIEVINNSDNKRTRMVGQICTLTDRLSMPEEKTDGKA